MMLDNENTDQVITAMKSNLQQRPHTSHASQRNALGDIGNKVSAISISDNVGKKGPIKKEIVQLASQQQKVLTKNKATSSLKALVEEHGAHQVSLFKIPF